MEYPPILQNKYNQCSEELKKFFRDLIEISSQYSKRHSPVKMKEYHYCLQKEYLKVKGRKIQNYCLYTLTPFRNGVTVHLRTEWNKISDYTLKIEPIIDSSYLRGNGWVKFSIRSQSDLSEALKLIKRIYEAKD